MNLRSQSQSESSKPLALLKHPPPLPVRLPPSLRLYLDPIAALPRAVRSVSALRRFLRARAAQGQDGGMTSREPGAVSRTSEQRPFRQCLNSPHLPGPGPRGAFSFLGSTGGVCGDAGSVGFSGVGSQGGRPWTIVIV
jgi:hypothetical protein